MKKSITLLIVFVIIAGTIMTPFVAANQIISHPIETGIDFISELLEGNISDYEYTNAMERLQDDETTSWDDLAMIYYQYVPSVSKNIDKVVNENSEIPAVTVIDLVKPFLIFEFNSAEIEDIRILANYIRKNMSQQMDYEKFTAFLLSTEPFKSAAKKRGMDQSIIMEFYSQNNEEEILEEELDLNKVSGTSKKIVMIAKSKLGCRYYWGATGPNYFDCSGLVYYCLKNAGINIGRLTASGYSTSKYFKVISYSQLQPGDFITFKNNGRVGHIGIYVGNGKMIHASGEGSTCLGNHANHKVKYGDVGKNSYYYNRIYNCIRVR